MERSRLDSSTDSPSKARKVGVYRAPDKPPARTRLLMIAVAVSLVLAIGLYLLFRFVF